MMNPLNVKDSRWLTLEVCREYTRNKCVRTDTECKFAHPPPHVEVQNGRVTCCFDSIKGKCQRKDPPCKYLHPPQHLKEQLLQNGRNNLIIKNLHLQAHAFSGVAPMATIPAMQQIPAASAYMLPGMPQTAAAGYQYMQPTVPMPAAALMPGVAQNDIITNNNTSPVVSTATPVAGAATTNGATGNGAGTGGGGGSGTPTPTSASSSTASTDSNWNTGSYVDGMPASSQYSHMYIPSAGMMVGPHALPGVSFAAAAAAAQANAAAGSVGAGNSSAGSSTAASGSGTAAAGSGVSSGGAVGGGVGVVPQVAPVVDMWGAHQQHAAAVHAAAAAAAAVASKKRPRDPAEDLILMPMPAMKRAAMPDNKTGMMPMYQPAAAMASNQAYQQAAALQASLQMQPQFAPVSIPGHPPNMPRF